MSRPNRVPIRSLVWTKEGAWPLDPSGYVFIARALNALGARLTGTDWTGYEFGIVWQPQFGPLKPSAADLQRAKFIVAQDQGDELSPEIKALISKERRTRQTEAVRQNLVAQQVRPQSSRAVSNHDAARAKVAEARAASGSITNSVASPSRSPSTQIATDLHSDLDWIVAANFVIQQTETAAAPYLQRREAVMREMVRLCEAGDVQTYALNRATHALDVVPREQWRVDRGTWAWRFENCALGWDPGPSMTGQLKPQWLFLDRPGFDQFVAASRQSGANLTPSTATLSQAWSVRPGELQKAWLFRPEVLAAAEGRRTRPSEIALCEALAEMAKESGCTWTAASIGATRRKTA